MQYEVLTPLKHNDVRYQPGELVELSEAEAAPMIPSTVRPVRVVTVEVAAPVKRKPPAKE